MVGNMGFALSCLLLFLISFLSLIRPIVSAPAPVVNTVLSADTSEISLAGKQPPKEIEPPFPKFKTTPDPGLPAEHNLNVDTKHHHLSSYDDELLTLTTTEFMPGIYQARLPIGNGYFGTQVAAAGPYFEKDVNQTNPDGTVMEGWPLDVSRQVFATIAGFWDRQATIPRNNFPELLREGDESVISGAPYPLGIVVQVGEKVLDATVDPSALTNYIHSKVFSDGTVIWEYDWLPSPDVRLGIKQTTFIDRSNPNGAATELQVTPHGQNLNVTIIDIIDGRSARRSHLVWKAMLPNCQIAVEVHPDGLPNILATLFSTADVDNGYTDMSTRRIVNTTGWDDENDKTIGQAFDAHLVDGRTAIFRKFIGFASSDHFADTRATARASSMTAKWNGWAVVLSKHTKVMGRLMARDLMDDFRDASTGKLPNDTFIEELQIVAVVNRDILLMTLLPEDGLRLNNAGVSPVGLFAEGYGGMVFWDQETWIFPSVALANPEYALQMLNYRIALLPQARANAQEGYVKEFYNFSSDSVLYPWTSGRFGNATSTGPAVNYEFHLNLDIALACLQFRRITGNEVWFRKSGWPLVKAVGSAIADVLKKDGNGYSVLNMTDPDEYAASIDNAAYTLAACTVILKDVLSLKEKYGEEINATWLDMAYNVNIPRASSGITEEYFGMKGNISVKQADIQLMTHVLHFVDDYSLENKRIDLGYYTQKQNPDGPAMTFSSNAIVENQVAESGCSALTFHYQATVHYLRAPWYLISEVSNDDVNGNGGVPPAFPFVTGHGGAAQISTIGYLGLDLTKDELTIAPALPGLPYLRVPDFHYQGAQFSATMNQTHTNLTRVPSRDCIVTHDIYNGKVVVGDAAGRRTGENHTIDVNQTITIANDMYWQNVRTPGNILQCQSTTSQSEHVLGQWARAATDGNPTTTWQSLTTDPSNITVDISHVPFQLVESLKFDWQGRPPISVRVGFSNSSDVMSFDDPRMRIIDVGKIEPNQAYQDLSLLEPVPYVGNTTEYLVKELIYTGKFSFLETTGCNGCGALNSWTGGDGLRFNPDENTFGATVGEFEIIGKLGVKVLG